MADERRTPSRVVGLLAPLVLLAPAAAHAEKVVTNDGVGDAQVVTTSFPPVGEQVVTTEPAPDETSVDITRTVVAHGDNRLRITVHVRDLVPSSLPTTFLRVVTPQQPYELIAGKSPGSRAEAVLTRRGLEADCRGLKARVDGTTDTVTVSLPTTCISSPRWVEVGAGIVRTAPASDDDADGYVQYADDGHRDVVRENSLGLGPKVYRG